MTVLYTPVAAKIYHKTHPKIQVISHFLKLHIHMYERYKKLYKILNDFAL